MVETDADICEASAAVTRRRLDWLPPSCGSALPAPQAGPAPSQSYQASQDQHSTAVLRPESDSSCMEIEAAQRKLQEIEDR